MFGTVGRQVGKFLTDAGEEVYAIDKTAGPGVDLVGDGLEASVLAQAPLADARAVILALDSDSATVLAATVVRSYASDVPIIARVNHIENIGRVQQAGVDFALAPRRAFLVTLQLGLLLGVAFPVLAMSQPFFPSFLGIGVLLATVAVLGYRFWYTATDLQEHVRAGAEVVNFAFEQRGLQTWEV